jgi:septal ring-binding cell division protein DamX
MPRDKGLFAVRVGTYPDRREADAVRVRLERDEQFKKPWVTR